MKDIYTLHEMIAHMRKEMYLLQEVTSPKVQIWGERRVVTKSSLNLCWDKQCIMAKDR